MAIKVGELQMRCVIIAGSPKADIAYIKSVVSDKDYVICADRGCNYALQANISPDLIIGDFDSYTEKIPFDCEIIKLKVHKDDTDTQHCVDVAFERGFKDIVILCGTGGRLDHTIANISVLQYIAEKGGKGLLLSAEERIEILDTGNYNYNGYSGKTFSVFPFSCNEICVSYNGTEYALQRGLLTSSVAMGISNVFTSDKASVVIHSGYALMIINT